MGASKKKQGARAKSENILASALADKGGPGAILIGLTLVVVWGGAIAICLGLLHLMGSTDIAATAEGALPAGIWILAGYLMAMGGVILVAFLVTRSLVQVLLPTLKVDAEARGTLASAFGGRLLTIDGVVGLVSLSKTQAQTRAKKILQALTTHACARLGEDKFRIGANVFVSHEPTWLTIHKKLHVNLDHEDRGSDELAIKILNGFYSTGTAYWYGRPVLSLAEDRQEWSHTPTEAALSQRGYSPELLGPAGDEVKKASGQLSWIISMPIPFQISPFGLICGVLNLDSLGRKPQRDELKLLLADVAVAAALIGLINRTTDILESNCQRPDPGDVQGTDKLKSFLISAEEFNPADCPEPSGDFIGVLSKIAGLEFLRSMSSGELALFLREQLRY